MVGAPWSLPRGSRDRLSPQRRPRAGPFDTPRQDFLVLRQRPVGWATRPRFVHFDRTLTSVRSMATSAVALVEVAMPVSLTYPGVYVEEIPSGVRSITGVA